MKNIRLTTYYSHRIALENLKQKTWIFFILARILCFLANLVDHYLR